MNLRNINLKKIIKNLGVFDYLLIGVFIVGVVVFAYIFFRKSSYITVTVKAGEDNVTWGSASSKSWFSQLFYKGMREKDGIGRTQAEVLDVFSYDTEANRKALYIKVKLKSVYSKASGQYTYKGKPVLVGGTVKLLLNNINFEGLIVNIEGMKDPRERVKLRIESRLDGYGLYQDSIGALPYLIDSIKAGDRVYDSNGNTIIFVENKRVEESKRLVTTSDGRVLVKTNPLLKDMYITAIVDSTKVGGRYFIFDDITLSIGWGLPINLPFVAIYPTITKITEVQ